MPLVDCDDWARGLSTSQEIGNGKYDCVWVARLGLAVGWCEVRFRSYCTVHPPDRIRFSRDCWAHSEALNELVRIEVKIFVGAGTNRARTL